MALVSPYGDAANCLNTRPSFPGDRLSSESPESNIHGMLDTIKDFNVRHLILLARNLFLSKLLSVLVSGTMESSRNIANSTLICIAMGFVAPDCAKILSTLEP